MAASLALGAAPQPQPADIIIRDGTIYPGGAAPYRGDIAIRGDRIVYAGRRAPMSAMRVVDAKGMVVAPGFIDPHTHAGAMIESEDARTRLVLPFLMQGVTTAFIGNDGGGEPRVGALLGRIATKPVGINVGAYVGFGAVRKAVIGEARRAPTPAELDAMRGLVRTAMCEGALGLSTGLFYAPQSFAETSEVVALAREAGAAGGTYDSHIRDESSYTIGLEAAIQEALTIGREARVPVNISHIKALGVDVHGRAPAVVARIEAARAAGQRVTADQYPWSASGTSLGASLLPIWAMDGGRTAYLQRFADAAVAARLRREMADNLRRRGGAEALLITQGAEKGRTLAEVATGLGQSPVEAAIATITVADPAVASFNQDERDIAAFMARPWVMTGSDASTGHPRVYGSFARKYAEYVRKRRVISLRQFVDRSSTLAADTFGLADRGRLAAGKLADIVVFDPRRYRETATYQQPEQLAEGVRTVVVAGRIAVDGGQASGVAAGRALRHAPTEGYCR